MDPLNLSRSLDYGSHLVSNAKSLPKEARHQITPTQKSICLAWIHLKQINVSGLGLIGRRNSYPKLLCVFVVQRILPCKN